MTAAKSAAAARSREIAGKTRALLTGERTALNFLGRLSGIATLTASFVGGGGWDESPHRLHAQDHAGLAGLREIRGAMRRRRQPPIRALRRGPGQGQPHRRRRRLAKALERLRARGGHLVKIEVEVDTLEQLEQALRFPIDAVLLDNMDVATLKKAVKLVAGRVVTEASGGVSLETVREIAATGVDLISVGALTHSPRNLDSSLEWKA